MKPIIGIVGVSDKSFEDYNVICTVESIRNAVVKSGGIPILILPSQILEYEDKRPSEVETLTSNEKDDLTKVVDLCDGILIPGAYKLFEYEKIIYRYALSKDIPILGICAGMQLLEYGLKEDRKDVIVKNETGVDHFKKGVQYVHSVTIKENTKLCKIIGKTSINVNSRHNYHVSNVSDFIVSAVSEDGLIEAIEYPGKKFVLGVQWHPESMIDYDENQIKIFNEFINCCRK